MVLVGIVAVSHSRALAAAAVELAMQMVHDERPKVVVAAGTADGGLGTDAVEIASAIQAAETGAGVVVLVDLGSAILSAELALDLYEGDTSAVRIVPAPFVEGLLTAVVRAATGGTLDDVAGEAVRALASKVDQLGGSTIAPTLEAASPKKPDASGTATILNQLGLHVRPVAHLVATVSRFTSEVWLRRNDKVAAAKSPVALAGLAARVGDEVVIEAYGDDAQAAVDAVSALFADGFGELDAPVSEATAPAARGPQGVSAGRVVGVAKVMIPAFTQAPAESAVSPADMPAERQRLLEALEHTAVWYERQAERATPEARDILIATAAMARDPLLVERAGAKVGAFTGCAGALWQAIDELTAEFHALGGVMAERITDLADIRNRTVAHLTGMPVPGLPESASPFILVARDVAPADAARISADKCLGIVTVEGGPTSHTSILARSMGIATVVGLADALAIPDGAQVLVDGGTGEVVVWPSEEQRADARTAPAELVPLSSPGATADGARVPLLANVASAGESELAQQAAAEGVGLFRTEICFLGHTGEPSVAEQARLYESVLSPFAGRRVVVRTLDAGSDKPLDFLQLGDEENPALGLRGFRTSRHAPEVLARQLDAIAAAGRTTDADVWVMAPMISTPDEAADFAAKARAAGLEKVGVMVEVPAAAVCARDLLAHVDFVSIGSNDLTQYAMAVDRMAAGVPELQDPWNPGVLRLIGMVGEAGRELGKSVGCCGEAAADPALAPVLVGLGVTSLSMSPRALEPVRQALAVVSDEQCQAAAAAALASLDPASAREAACVALLAGEPKT